MSDFQYTDRLENINSTAVKHAYYNTHDKTLVVVMRANGNAYRYDGVPSWVWSAFKGASSKGTHFATTIKRSYGPSKYLGVGRNLSITEYSVAAPNMGTVTPLRGNGGYVSLGGRPAPTPAAVGTPKALVDKTSSSVEAFPQGVRKATTSVTIESANGEHTVAFDDKSTVDEALAAIDDLSNKLGVSVKVKAVTVHFE